MEVLTLNKQKRSLLIAGVALLVIVAVVAGVYFLILRPQGNAGLKDITVEVVDLEGNKTSFNISTDAEFLRGALEQAELIGGTESEMGMFITTVNGITANDGNQEWWCITQEGEMVMFAVDQVVIADGDQFELTLTQGYE